MRIFRAPLELPFQGVYMNLDRSKRRRAHLETQLRKFKLLERYQRLSAIDGRQLQPSASSRLVAGEVATLMSHIAALRSLAHSGQPAHVLEDDTVLSRHVGPVMTRLIGEGIFDQFDVVYTDIIVVPIPAVVSSLRAALGDKKRRRPADFSVTDLKTINFSGGNSYFVGPGAVERVADILDTELRSGPALPTDLCLSKNIKHGVIRAACVMPFITTVDFELSTNSEVSGRAEQANDTVIAIDLLRPLFFVDARLDSRLAALLNQLVGKQTSCRTHQDYFDAILERLKNHPVME